MSASYTEERIATAACALPRNDRGIRAACYAATRTLYAEMCAAAKSLLAHTDLDRIYFLAEDDTLPWTLPPAVEVVNVGRQRFFRPDGPNYRTGWTYMVLMKAALHRLFPDLDRILMLDCDTIVRADVGELWELDLEGRYLAAAREPLKTERSGALYVNAGVLMMNLAQLRADGKGDELIASLNARPWEYCEQDAIAALCRGGILEIGSEFNANAFTLPCREPKILHYAAVYRWQEAEPVRRWKAAAWPERNAGRGGPSRTPAPTGKEGNKKR